MNPKLRLREGKEVSKSYFVLYLSRCWEVFKYNNYPESLVSETKQAFDRVMWPFKNWLRAQSNNIEQLCIQAT